MKKILILFLMVTLFSFSTAQGQKRKKKSRKKIKTSSISKIEKEVLAEINSVRRNPKKYIKFLKKLKKRMKGNNLTLPNGKRWAMSEGKRAINSAIKDLKRVKRLKALKLSNGLSQAADIQLNDLKKNPKLGHRGKDGSNVFKRVSRVGAAGSTVAENITYYSNDAQIIVLMQIIDDGVRNRGHRKNILNRNFTQIGIAYGKGKKDIELCVMVFTDSFIKMPKGAKRVY